MPDVVPLNDLRRLHAPIRAEIDSAVARVLDSGWFLRGREVAAFEEEWADFCGQKYAVACNSGTDALTLAALGLQLRQVDVQANTLALTAIGLQRGGATVNVVDVDADGRLPAGAADAVPVLLYGRLPSPAENRHSLFDAAHAHGWRPPSHATACWSFYPTKTLGAVGDGGAATTNDQGLADAMRDLTGRDDQLRDGRQITSRMDEIQAAILRVKLKRLPRWIAERQAIGVWYRAHLPVGAEMVATGHGDLHHLAVVRVARRDSVAAALKARGVETKVHFPTPLHRQEAAWGDPSQRLPVAEAWSETVLSLPCFPGMTEQELTRVAEALSHCVCNPDTLPA